MSTTHPLSSGTALQPRAINLMLIGVFTGTIFLSALLLFSVQPMFAKMVLPLLGGSPSVWSVAMVFFQAVLLLGYGYAHALTRFLDPRRAVIVHLCVFAVALTALPLSVAAGWGRPPADHAAFWLIGLFGVSIGLPFFAVAANAPMLQAWFARTSHPQANDPYFLYGASNLGSFAALLAYPILIEPFLTLREQSSLWSAGFVALMVTIATAGLALTMNFKVQAKPSPQAVADAAIRWADRLQWMALAFVPSALLIAVTSHISTDIASAPFLWIVPLALFLATFVLTFRHGGDRVHDILVRVQPFVVAPLVIGLMWGERAYWLVAIMLDLSMLGVSAMICHRELYLRRPAASHLTEFYLWISAGGVLGGIATGLLAPAIFPDVWGISDPDRAGLAVPAGRIRERRKAVAARRRLDRGRHRARAHSGIAVQGQPAAGSGNDLDHRPGGCGGHHHAAGVASCTADGARRRRPDHHVFLSAGLKAWRNHAQLFRRA